MAAPPDNLRLAAAGHLVLGALAALLAPLPLLFVWMGRAVVRGRFALTPGHPPSPDPLLGWIVIALGAGLFTLGVAYAVLLLLAGRALRARRRWGLCVTASALSCIFFPAGTALGIYTLALLVRPEVRATFVRAGATRAGRDDEPCSSD